MCVCGTVCVASCLVRQMRLNWFPLWFWWATSLVCVILSSMDLLLNVSARKHNGNISSKLSLVWCVWSCVCVYMLCAFVCACLCIYVSLCTCTNCMYAEREKNLLSPTSRYGNTINSTVVNCIVDSGTDCVYVDDVSVSPTSKDGNVIPTLGCLTLYLTGDYAMCSIWVLPSVPV